MDKFTSCLVGKYVDGMKTYFIGTDIITIINVTMTATTTFFRQKIKAKKKRNVSIPNIGSLDSFGLHGLVYWINSMY